MKSSGKLAVDNLSDTECERLLNVLQRDLQLRNRERDRLRVLEKDIWSEQQRREALKAVKNPITNKYCLSCFAPFNFLLNRPKICIKCLEKMCKRCSTISTTDKTRRICYFCIKKAPEDVIPLTPDKPPQPPRTSQPYMYDNLMDSSNSLQDSIKKFTTSVEPQNNRTNLTSRRERSNSKLAQFCSRCGEGLSALVKRNAQCVICMQWICKPCALWEPKHGGYICDVHTDEINYSQYNKKSTDWMYDSTRHMFVRTYRGELAATVSSRLNADLARPVTDEIPLLSLESFVESMNGKEFGSGLSVATDTDSNSNELPAKTDKSKMDLVQNGSANGNLEKLFSADIDDVDGKTERSQTFSEVKDAETKRFLIEIHAFVQKIRERLANRKSDDEAEEMLASHRSAISSLIANMEQSLHLAVDNQEPNQEELVRHTEVASLVCSIVEEYVGESVANDVLTLEGGLNYGEVADCIIIKIVEDEESDTSIDDDVTVTGSNFKPEFSPHVNEHGSKLPEFTFGASTETDSDLLSLGQGNHTERESDIDSAGSSRWDEESIVSDTSNNWFFRGKQTTPDGLSDDKDFFNKFSDSEESLNMIAVPRASYSSDRSDEQSSGNDSDVTLTSLPEDYPAGVENQVTMSDIMKARAERSFDEDNHSVTSSNVDGKALSKTYSETGSESEELKFTTKPKTQTVRSGEVAKFTCVVTGASHTDVYWFKEGVDEADAIESNEKYEVTSEDDKNVLEIFFTTSEDSGQYLCLARNDTTTSHWLFGLHVDEDAKYDQKPPLFLKEPYDMEAYSGDIVKFKCKVRAYPPPRVTWYKDGERIENSPCYKLEKFGNRDYMLTINGVTADHDAEYTVLAKNGAGEAKSSAQLLVESIENSDKTHGRRRELANLDVSDPTYRRRKHYALAYGDEEEGTGNDIRRNRRPLSLLQEDAHNASAILNHLKSPDAQTESEPILKLSELKHEFSKPAARCSELHQSSQSMETTSESVRETTPAPPSRRSLRAALHNDSYGEVNVEEKHTVRITPIKNSLSNQLQTQKTQQKVDDEVRHSSVVQLSMSTSDAKVEQVSSPDQTKASIDANDVKIKPQALAKDGTQSNNDVDEKSSTTNTQSCHNSTAGAGVDIQPGYVRERQFEQFGDRIVPSTTPRHTKGIAPFPPIKPPETIELRGASQQEDLPSSRSEWSNFFPFVQQRRRSFASDSSSPSTNQAQNLPENQPLPAETNNNTPKTKAKKKNRAPAPPTSENVEPAKKKTVRKVVKRTVSVTCRTPVSSTDPGQGPPDDGCEYIKISGRWVRLKSSPLQKREPSRLEGNTTTKSEWREDVAVDLSSEPEDEK